MPYNTTVSILVATHKRYTFPGNTLYHPIQVGASRTADRFGYLTDDTAINMSDKNDTFCELTALYWAWKNHYFDSASYCGMVHYRRYFAGDERFGETKILSADRIETLMVSHDVIVPKKRHYIIETVYRHYKHAHYGEDLDKLREIIISQSPEFLKAYDRVLNQRSLYLYNMFVMKPSLFGAYCEWLFPLLLTLEKEIDLSGRNTYQKRVFGFLGERLFNVWLQQKQLNVIEVKTINLEGENLLQKGSQMLGRMILNKRRES